jgi:hypothetical protein
MNSLSRYYLFIFWVSLMPQIFNSISLSLVWKHNQAESYFTTVRFRLCVVSLILANLMKGTTPQLAAIPSATSIRWDWWTFSLTTQKKFFFFFIPFFFFHSRGPPGYCRCRPVYTYKSPSVEAVATPRGWAAA